MEHNAIHERKEFIFQLMKRLRPIDIAVLITSVTALYLFRLQDGHQLEPIWQLKEPTFNPDNLYCKPLIADIDGNGLKELIIVSADKIAVYVHHANDMDNMHHEHGTDEEKDTTQGVLYHLHLKSELKLGKILGSDQSSVYPIAINAGCSKTSYNGLCPKSLAIVWSDWSVTLLSDQLKILWKSKPFKLTLSEKLKITEMNVLVVQPNISDFAGSGLVIVGGEVNVKDLQMADTQREDEVMPTMPSGMSEEISKERAGVEPNITHNYLSLDPDLAKFIGHYTTYALDGKTGEIKWKHEPGDFEAETSDVENHLHFKLRLRKKRLHKGEEHWKKFSRSLLKHLPYTWKDSDDSDITLGHFEKSFSSAPTQSTPSEVVIPQQFRGIFGKAQKEDVLTTDERPNTVVLRHRRAIEVLSLDNGSPVCVLPVDSTSRISLGDVNGDDTIDSLQTYFYQDSSVFATADEAPEHEDTPFSHHSCYITATDAATSSLVYFNSSMCEIPWLFGFSNYALGLSVRFNTQFSSLAPVLVKPTKRSSGFLQHVLGYGLFQPQAGMDTFVLLSFGKLAAFGPSGRFLWQVDTGIVWSDTDVDIKRILSLRPISLNEEERKDAMVILAPREILAISLVDGSILSTHSLPCLSVQPLISGDIDNDINDEFLVRCTDRYVGFSLKRYNRTGLTILLYSGVAFSIAFLLLMIKFIEKEDLVLDTVDNFMQSMRLFPRHAPRL